MKLFKHPIGSASGVANRHASLLGLQRLHSRLRQRQEGKIGWIFLWLIGVPVPLLLVFFLLRGCT